jgi:hypothetical protein
MSPITFPCGSCPAGPYPGAAGRNEPPGLPQDRTLAGPVRHRPIRRSLAARRTRRHLRFPEFLGSASSACLPSAIGAASRWLASCSARAYWISKIAALVHLGSHGPAGGHGRSPQSAFRSGSMFLTQNPPISAGRRAVINRASRSWPPRLWPNGRVAGRMFMQRRPGSERPDLAPLCVIPEEAGGVKGGFCVGGGCFGACVTGVSCFPGSCHVRGGPDGRVKDRAQPGRRGGAGGVLEVTGRVPDDLAAGKREPGACGVIRLSGSVPWWGPVVRAVPLAAVIPSRVPGRGRGRMGRVRVRRSGQAGSIKGAPARPGEGGGADTGGGLAPGRRPARAVHAARAGSWPAADPGRQRICPSRRP